MAVTDKPRPAQSHTAKAKKHRAKKKKTTLPVYDLTPFTMLDFPGRTACIVWFSGCNMRCPYCHNPAIVKGGSGRKSANDILDFLVRRRNLLDGVVLSGGEASLYKDIIPFARTVRNMGFDIKLDTNGTRPEIVKQLLAENLVDYIALDYKAPPAKTKRVTGIEKFNAFAETLDLLCGQNDAPFEVRTTVHTALLDEDDMQQIIADLDARGYEGTLYIQNFIQNDNPVLGDLPAQKRLLDYARLRGTKRVRLDTRNFPGT